MRILLADARAPSTWTPSVSCSMSRTWRGLGPAIDAARGDPSRVEERAPGGGMW